MAGLVYLFSLIYTAIANTAGLSLNSEIDLFLNTALTLNRWLFFIVLDLAAAIFLVGIIITVISIARGNKKFIWDKFSFGFSCTTCLTLPLLFLPVAQGLVYWANFLMANSFSAAGIIDPFKFWFGLVLTVLLIWG
ncbi:MAG: hypothetical protein WC768_00090 [Patescibacteria group bacterium]|jgi:hypothetical protein